MDRCADSDSQYYFLFDLNMNPDMTGNTAM